MLCDTKYDEIGRIFCAKHDRELCHECCVDFGLLNRQVEIDAGLLKPPTEIEKLAEDRANLRRGIKFMKEQKFDPKHENLLFHYKEFEKVEAKLSQLKLIEGNSEEIAIAIEAAELKVQSSAAEVDAVVNAWKAENPGKTKMEYGGPETQRLYELVAAPPPSTSGLDKNTCCYCRKSSASKLLCCGRCTKVYYCDKECQKAAWKGHKRECRAPGESQSSSHNTNDKNTTTPTTTPDPQSTDNTNTNNSKPTTKRNTLPLTWDQLAVYGGQPAAGKVLEVRIMKIDSFMRQVLHCKDRLGAVRVIAVYVEERVLPGAAPGRILRWKNPRYYYFLDGQSGCRVNDSDVMNIQISDD